MTTADNLNKEYPDLREDLAATYIEEQLRLLGVAVLSEHEEGERRLVLCASDEDSNLNYVKVTFCPYREGREVPPSWLDPNSNGFRVRAYVEELPELDENSTEEIVDNAFFAVRELTALDGRELLTKLLNNLSEDFSINLCLVSPPD